MSTFEGQNSEILYKLGGLEALVTEGMRRIDGNIETIKTELGIIQEDTTKELKILDERVSVLEDFKKEIVTKFTVIVTIVVGFWAVLGDSLGNALSKVLGI